MDQIVGVFVGFLVEKVAKERGLFANSHRAGNGLAETQTDLPERREDRTLSGQRRRARLRGARRGRKQLGQRIGRKAGEHALVEVLLGDAKGQRCVGKIGNAVQDQETAQGRGRREGSGPVGEKSGRFVGEVARLTQDSVDVFGADATAGLRFAILLLAQEAAHAEGLLRGNDSVEKGQIGKRVEGVVVNKDLQRGLGRELMGGMLKGVAEQRSPRRRRRSSGWGRNGTRVHDAKGTASTQDSQHRGDT